MAGVRKQDDVRGRKIETVLIRSLLTLLKKQNFNNITVNGLCEEAMVGRAVFYSYFADKYELARCFMARLIEDMLEIPCFCDQSNVIDHVNEFISVNRKEIINILKNANETTMGLIEEFLMNAACALLKSQHRNDTPTDTGTTVLLRFYAGGMIALFEWQMNNNFPPQSQWMNSDLYTILVNIFK